MMSVEGQHFWGPLPIVLIITVVFAMLPDFDALVGLLAGNIGAYHNNGTHSLIVGLAVSLLVAGLMGLRRKTSFLPWFLVLLISYESHVILDYFTFGGRGVMLFWPITVERFIPPILFFHGVRWSAGVYTTEHLLTIASESLIVLTVFLGIWLFEGRRRKRINQPVASPKWIDSSKPCPDDPSGIKR
jgi:membrane-bound metal-dependent hydrolase YbcI (DUF457 family)